MKKTILALSGAAFLGAATLVPTAPANAMFFLLPFVLEHKKDPNFKAVNPYAPTKAAKRSAKKSKKR